MYASFTSKRHFNLKIYKYRQKHCEIEFRYIIGGLQTASVIYY